MALAVVLVVGSGLLVRSFARLQAVDPGFARGSVLTFKVLPHPSAYPEMHRLTGFYDDLLGELGSLPGVVSVAAAYDHPLDSNWTQSFRLATGPEPDRWQTGAFRTVTPGYFRTLGVEILDGRGFTAGDHAAAPGAAIVNQAFVRRHFPDRAATDRVASDRPAVGQRLELVTTHWRWGDEAIPSSFEVVAVVEDVRFKGLSSPAEPAFYLPYGQTPHYVMTVLVRTEREPLALLPEIRARLRAIDPSVPIARVETLGQLLSSEVAKPRASAFALAAFAAGALLLAMIGMWGVLSFAVSRRTREIGVRMALGAAGRQVFGWAIWHGLRPALAGVTAGILGAAALSRVLRGVLYEISPTDPATFLAVPVLLLAAAFAACAVPAARAARTDPMAVLRDE
jgi:predicted permease